MVNLRQIRDHVIEPTLKAIDLYSPEAVDLIVFTGIQESGYKYIKQLGPGPALSFWQVEPNTLHDIYQNYLKFRPELDDLIKQFLTKGPFEEQLIWNLAFGVCMCRLVYRRHKMPLPAVGDGPGMAHIWKVAYNTPEGRGTELEFVFNWERHKHLLL